MQTPSEPSIGESGDARGQKMATNWLLMLPDVIVKDGMGFPMRLCDCG